MGQYTDAREKKEGRLRDTAIFVRGAGTRNLASVFFLVSCRKNFVLAVGDPKW